MDLHQLYELGVGEWNKWASKQLEQKPTDLKGTNYETWLHNSRADFRGLNRFRGADFAGYIFPSDADFRGVNFDGNTDFTRAIFCGDAAFNGATFQKGVKFFDMKFERSATFKGVEFGGDANFGKASFPPSHAARFDQAHLLASADFFETQFQGDTSFRQARFKGPTSFWESHFCKGASFNAIQAESAFSLANAQFDEVPDFIQANFPEAPRLDNVQVPIIGEWAGLRGCADPDAASRYRALKRLAIQGHDHDRELRFFADELRSLRGQPDQPLPNLRNLFRKGAPVWQGGARYWFGLFYEVFSDFGRSISRPLISWLLLTILFAEAYLFMRTPLSSYPSCIDGSGNPISQALYLSVKKGLVFPGLGGDQRVDEAVKCLFGDAILDRVSYTGIAQSLISVVLIFLFLLAVRNHFRIK